MVLNRDDPSGIILILKQLKENIERGHISPLPKIINSKIEKILSLDPKKDRENILEIYDDLLDEFITHGIEYPM
ncbi:MAG: hypothetical protein WA092_02990 [Minisyncoccales bacterium]